MVRHVSVRKLTGDLRATIPEPIPKPDYSAWRQCVLPGRTTAPQFARSRRDAFRDCPRRGLPPDPQGQGGKSAITRAGGTVKAAGSLIRDSQSRIRSAPKTPDVHIRDIERGAVLVSRFDSSHSRVVKASFDHSMIAFSIANPYPIASFS